VAPYWRIVGDRGELNPKWPTGTARQAEHLRREGHRILKSPRAPGLRVLLPDSR
jgi:alkylated DNA nucleotide flippase Atl1